MKYRKLGTTGLDVEPDLPRLHELRRARAAAAIPWSLDEEASRPFIQRVARGGHQLLRHRERLLGRHQRGDRRPRCSPSSRRRDEIVLATKVHGVMRQGPNGRGLSRKAIMPEIDAEPAPARHRLRRPLPDPPLGLPHADRGDDGGAARRREGRARPATSARRRCGPGSSRRRSTSRSCNGWTRFVSMQNHYNLLYREEEREMLPLCLDQGVGVIPWSPLARGRLTRDPGTSTDRSETDEFGKIALPRTPMRAIIEAVAAIAAEPRRAAGADRAGLGVEAPGGHRADRRRDEAAPSRRRDRVGRHRADGRRDLGARVAVHASARAGLRLTYVGLLSEATEPGGRHAGPLRQHLAGDRRRGR